MEAAGGKQVERHLKIVPKTGFARKRLIQHLGARSGRGRSFVIDDPDLTSGWSLYQAVESASTAEAFDRKIEIGFHERLRPERKLPVVENRRYISIQGLPGEEISPGSFKWP